MTPKPKAEETLKECAVLEVGWPLENKQECAAKDCPHRRTPPDKDMPIVILPNAKEDGEEMKPRTFPCVNVDCHYNDYSYPMDCSKKPEELRCCPGYKAKVPKYKRCPKCESFDTNVGPHTEEKGCWICESPKFKGYRESKPTAQEDEGNCETLLGALTVANNNNHNLQAALAESQAENERWKGIVNDEAKEVLLLWEALGISPDNLLAGKCMAELEIETISAMKATLAEKEKQIEEFRKDSVEWTLQVGDLEGRLEGAGKIIKGYAQCDIDCCTQHPEHRQPEYCNCGCVTAFKEYEERRKG